MPKRIAPPKVRRFKRSSCHDQAYIRLNGHRIILGAWGSIESHERYNQVIAEWFARGCRPTPPSKSATISECVESYLAYLDDYYRTSPASSNKASYSFKILVNLYGRMATSEFSAVHLRAVRESMINALWARTTINERIRTIVNMLKYCASLDMIPPDPYHKAVTLAPLKANRSAARETIPIKPPKIEHIEGVKERVTRSVRAMIELQMLTGCRPGEITQLKREDIDTTGDVWQYEVKAHKNSWRGRKRTIYFGRKAQAILKTFFLMRKSGEYLFQPADFYLERHEETPTSRRPGQKPNTRKSDRKINPCYDTRAYAKAIAHACKEDHNRGREAIPHWAPNALRHYAASELRKAYGIEVTRAVLGHANLSTSEIYAELDDTVIKRVMNEIG